LETCHWVSSILYRAKFGPEVGLEREFDLEATPNQADITSAIINLFDAELAQSNASLNCIYLITSGGRGKDEEVAI
jgi:hypothetical protein